MSSFQEGDRQRRADEAESVFSCMPTTYEPSTFEGPAEGSWGQRREMMHSRDLVTPFAMTPDESLDCVSSVGATFPVGDWRG